jgi:type IV secretory pathway VirB2 component (pilin)
LGHNKIKTFKHGGIFIMFTFTQTKTKRLYGKSKFFKAIKAAVSCLTAASFSAFLTICSYANEGAEAGGGTTDAWGTVTQLFKDWLPRIGGAGVIVGLVLLGLGFMRDDADSKMRGIMVIVGGAIIVFVGTTLVPTLLK